MKLKKLLKIINQPQRLAILHATRDNAEYVCFSLLEDLSKI